MIVCSQDSFYLVEWNSCNHLWLNTTLISSTLDLEETWNEKTQNMIWGQHFFTISLTDCVTWVCSALRNMWPGNSPTPWLCRTFVSPVTVPGVCSQPVGRPILLSPAQYLDGMTAQHLPCHMLINTYSNIKGGGPGHQPKVSVFQNL